MSFLKDVGNLGSALIAATNEQFTPGEITPRSLDTVDPNDPDRMINFGLLGDFAKNVDASAIRSYVETGSIRNIRPRNLEILMQEPDFTVVVKKRLFSSLIDNYRLDLMDSTEKLFIRASKKLFQNKCQAISIYERLTKIEKVIKNKGVLDEYMVPQILSGVDALDAIGLGKDLIDGKTRAVLNTLRKLNYLSEPTQITTWITDREFSFASETGEGTGVFEITLASNINTTTSTSFGKGSASINFEDPYQLMIVTEEDIEKALTEATNFFNNNNFFRVADQELERITEDLKQQLNSIRLSRGAPPIRIIVNDDSILYRRIRAIIDETGQEIFFNYDPGVLGIGATIDIDAENLTEPSSLTPNETNLFKTIVKNLYQILNLRRNTQSQIKQFNEREDIRKVREKMMLHYNGKTIIQPMDVVHVFCSSKTSLDPKVIGFTKNSLSGFNVANAFNRGLQDIKENFNNLASIFGGTKNSAMDVEKNAIVGAEFPTWLWSILRNDFTRQSAGVQTFCGVVKSASSSYNDGKYTVSIQAQDNCCYFDMGQVNFKPAVDVFNGALYDPLTPFKLDFDVSTGFLRGEFPDLLEENIILANSGALKFKSGRFRGSPFSEDIYKIRDGERVDANIPLSYRMVLNDPDGLVYRWKSGIGTLTKFGEPHPLSSIIGDTSPSLTKDPFAGQDVMNVLSLLITGQPYNYNNFVLAAVNVGNLSRDDLLNQDGSVSYFRGLLSDLTKNNMVWGNFIPFKQQILNERGFSFLLKEQFEASTINNQLNNLLEERAKRFDALLLTLGGEAYFNNPQVFKIDSNYQPTGNKGNADLQKIIANIKELDENINNTRDKFQQTITNPNINDGSLKIFGDDISYDPNVSDISSSLTEDERVKAKKEFRQKLNFLTQRRLWKVKANEDINLFIVDDQYDTSFDIQAFEKALAGQMQKFNSEYSSVGEKINQVAIQLGLEVYADTQGHIRARPPGYNKMPSSVFYNMLKTVEKTGKRIFPRTLENLFINQIDGLTDKLEITEDEIRLRTAALGFGDDLSSEAFLSSGMSSADISPNANFYFKFTTSEDSGTLGSVDFRNIIQQANPDLRDGIETKPLKQVFDTISGQVRKSMLFSTNTRINAINNNTIFGNISDAAQVRFEKITNRLERLKGVSSPKNPAQMFKSDRNRTFQTDVLNVVNEISRLISERQSLLKMLSNAIKNLDQGLTINNDPDSARSLLFPNLYGRQEIPDILEHMIEDESNDDYGPGSGGRYVIKDNQIINFTIQETPPQYTAVEVHGLFGEGFVPPPSSLSLGNGGNAVSTAYAVDYDLWRMYGFKMSNPIDKVRTLSDPDSQLAPFAVFLLNKARQEIFKGTLTIVGNEYMQPGEVIYIESKNLLFYVDSVNHNLSYSGSFTTTLSLSFGRTPGEYIPTMLDIIGKSLYTKRHQANLIRHIRHGHPNGEVPLTALVIDNRINEELELGDPLQRLVGGSFGEQNRKNLANIIVAASGALTPTLGKIPKIELRIYYNSEAGVVPDSVLRNVAGSIEEWLKNPSQKSIFGDNDLLPDSNLPNGFSLGKNQIEVVFIDRNDPKSPSSGAWNIVRHLRDNQAFPTSENPFLTKEDLILFQNVIDIWMTFEDVPNTTETSRGVNQSVSQLQNETTEKVADLTSKKVVR